MPGNVINGDGICDAADMDELSLAIRQGLSDTMYDLDGDLQVTTEDRNFWINVAKGSYIGDWNGDREFSSDFVAVFGAGQ